MSSLTVDSSPVESSNVDRNRARAQKLLFASTSFLSAFLLFQMQLIVSKSILPWFGGSAAVWTTSMLVFQALLLGGYIYSHVISVRLSASAQTRIHLALLLIAFLMVLTLSLRWPSAITPGAAWKPEAGADPTRDVMTIILVSAGFPFFVLSTTAPLLQRWFARLGGGSGTYKLYSISNVGSLLGLLTFPFLLEPLLRLQTQGRLWSILFCGFIAGCGMCTGRASNVHEETHPEEAQTAEKMAGADTETQPSALTYAVWFLLAACSSSLLLATTNLLCQEVTTVPLLWVLPLALYLLSFILCFDNPRWYRREIFHPLFAVTLFLTCAAAIVNNIQIQAILLPGLLFFSCMICHGELVRLKPSVKRLTSFYLALSAGGAAGGVFVGVVAPHLFKFFTEFQVTLGAIVFLLLVCLVLDPVSWIYERGVWLPAAITGGVVLSAYAGGLCLPGVSDVLERTDFLPFALSIGGAAVLTSYVMGRRQDDLPRPRAKRRRKPEPQPTKRTQQKIWPTPIYVGFLAGLAWACLYHGTLGFPEPYLSVRNFYGALRVYRVGPEKVLVNGRTWHGVQLDPPNNRVPVTYYGPKSGIGIVLLNHPKLKCPRGESPRRISGARYRNSGGYGQPGDYFRFYEINPEVVNLSLGPQPVFTYLRDSVAHVDVELGDARLLLEKELAKGQVQKFDVIVLDAFTGDAIPVHLLTREAFETYWKFLDPDRGIIAVHVSSRHVNLVPVLQGASAYFHAESVFDDDRDAKYPFEHSVWVLLARHPEALNIPGLENTPPPATKIPPRLWTDDYSAILRLIQW